MKQRIILCITIGLLYAAVIGGCGTPGNGSDAGAAGTDDAADTDGTGESDDGAAGTADAADTDGTGESDDGTADDGNSAASDEDTTETGGTASGTIFEATDMNGDIVSSDIFLDSRLTMVNVWATYCGPCLREMPELGELAAEYEPADFQLIGVISDVTEDAKQKDLDYAADLIEQTGADYTHLLLNESLYYSLLTDVSAVPTTFFIDEDGVIVETVVGARDKTSWKEIIDALLEE